MRETAPLPDPWFVTVQEALAGDYSLEREIGRGGMGIVYLAREVALDRLVALKVLPPALAGRAELRERFLSEARTAARLSHPNIVPIHRVGAVGSVVFFAMAYIEGETLGARLRKRGALPGAEVMRVVKETAWALAYAHRQGVVHRDVKPDNILIEARTGRVVVADFGIAQVGNAQAESSSDNGAHSTAIAKVVHVSGTAQFMSPEQAMGDPVDGRSDLYALGVMAYLCVSGRLPFDHENPSALLAQHVSAPVPAIARADVPVALSRAIARCLEKSPDKRFASGEALVDMLDAAHGMKRQVAPTLVKWAEARDPFVPMYLLWDFVFAMKTTMQLAMRFDLLGKGIIRSGSASVPVMLLEAAGFMLLPWVASLGFHLVRTWRMTRMGYGISDLREAIKASDEREREVQLIDATWSRNRFARLLKVATVVAMVAAVTSIAAPGVMIAAGIRVWNLKWFLANYSQQIVFGAGAVVWAASAYGVELPGRFIARRFRHWRDRMWHGPLGARVASWLSRIAPQGARAFPPIDRPTEVALELAAQRMFDALPTAMRLSMPEFPRVLDALARVAARARDRQRELLAAEGGAVAASGPLASEALQHGAAADGLTPNSVYSDALARAEHELSDAVQAMERLRLGVMRLYARSDNATQHTQLRHELHAVTSQLRRLNSADEEVERLLASPADAPALLPARARRAKRWWPFGVHSQATPTPTS